MPLPELHGAALGILGVMSVLGRHGPGVARILRVSCRQRCLTSRLHDTRRRPASFRSLMWPRRSVFALAFLGDGSCAGGRNITWQNLRVMSLLEVSLSVSSGSARRRICALRCRFRMVYAEEREQVTVITTCLRLLDRRCESGTRVCLRHRAFECLPALDRLRAVRAWRFLDCMATQVVPFTWIGAALLLFSLAHNFTRWVRFPVANGSASHTRRFAALPRSSVLGTRAAKSSLNAQLRGADLDRARRDESVSGQHVGSYLDAGATSFLDRGNPCCCSTG